MLWPPKFFSLDSSHFSKLAKDWSSGVAAERVRARGFIQETLKLGWVPLISWHQIEELIQFEHDEAVDARLLCLRSWPLMSWIRPSEPSIEPGSFLDVLRVEIEVAYAHPGLGALAVRDLVRQRVIEVGTGSDAITGEFLLTWRGLRPALEERKRHARRVTAVSGWNVPGMDNSPLSEWMKLPLREPGPARTMLLALRRALDDEIRTHGDRLIGDAERESIVEPFADEVAAGESFFREQGSAGPDRLHPMLRMLTDAGLDLEQIDVAAPVLAVQELLVFQTRLRQFGPRASAWDDLKRTVTRDRLPGVVIEDAIRHHGQALPVRPGSDLNDTHLLRLSPYADMTFIDKRTMENVRRATAKVANFKPLVGLVAKAGSYPDIPPMLLAS